MDTSQLKRLGLKIGHYTDSHNLTGTTVFITDQGADIGIDIRGAWPGFLSAPYYGATSAASIAEAVVLTGGSTYGLEAVLGAVQFLEENGIGTMTRAGILPAVAAAVIYDLGVGNGKIRPTKENGYEAASRASDSNLQQGNIGVGTGATSGKWIGGKKLKGGFGMAVTKLPIGIEVGAFVVTNSVGDATGLMDHQLPDPKAYEGSLFGLMRSEDPQTTNTTLSVVATNAAMDKIQLMKVSELTHDGMARAIFPLHTMLDGDTVFALSSHSGERKEFQGLQRNTLTDLVGIAAQDAVANAIQNSLKAAKPIPGYPALRQQ